VVLRIGFNPTRSTSPCYNNYAFMQNTVIQKIHTFTYIHKNESKHSEMGPVRQNPIRRPVRSVYVCVLHCAQLLHTILHRTDLIIFPLTLQTITIAMMSSIWGKGRLAPSASH